jgi:hypothetical protein
MSHQDDEIELWLRRAAMYRRRGMPVEMREAMRVAQRIINLGDLVSGGTRIIEETHERANAAVQRNPGAEAAIRNVEDVVNMVIPTIIFRYGMRP